MRLLYHKIHPKSLQFNDFTKNIVYDYMKNQRNYKRTYANIVDLGSYVLYVMHIFLENI